MTKPREWTIMSSKYDVHEGIYHKSDDTWLDKQIAMDAWQKIEVIEKSAYDDLVSVIKRMNEIMTLIACCKDDDPVASCSAFYANEFIEDMDDIDGIPFKLKK